MICKYKLWHNWYQTAWHILNPSIFGVLSLEAGLFLHAELSLPVHSPKHQTSETDSEGHRHGVALQDWRRLRELVMMVGREVGLLVHRQELM